MSAAPEETDVAQPFLSVAPRPSSKLRGRIMAAGYRYKLLDESNQEFEDGREIYQRFCCLQRGLCVALFVLVLLFMALLVCFLVVLFGDIGVLGRHCDSDDTNKECVSPGCIKTSAEILSKLDQKVDPCTDMYHYACGGWIKETNIPLGQYKINMFSEASERNDDFLRKFLEGGTVELKGHNLTSLSKLKTAYRSCMDKDALERVGITKLVEIVNQLGSWTVVQGVNNISRWEGDQWDFQTSLEASHNLWGSGLFSYGLWADAKNTSQRILTFAQAGITLSYPNEYSNADSQKFEDGFLDYASQVAVLLGGDKEAARRKMKDVFDLEKELAKIFLPRSEMTNPLDMYNKMTLKEFQAIIGPSINIKRYLQATFNGRQFSDSEEIIVSTLKYFKNISSTLQQFNKETLANYLVWNTLQGFMAYMPETFLEARFPLSRVEMGVSELTDRWKRCASYAKFVLGFAASAVYVDAKFSPSDKAKEHLGEMPFPRAYRRFLLSRVETGVSELTDRWKRCASYAKFVLGFAASAVYVDAKFSPSDKAKVIQTIENIRQDFISNLASVEWLDDPTRARLKDKAEAVVFNIGYPDWIMDPAELDDYYRKLELKDDAFLENKLATIEFLKHKAIEKYGVPPDKNEWTEFPITVNGFYSPKFNMVMMPAGILQPPFFNRYSPKPYLYSTIGMVVGHELTHAFDNSGRMYDKYGNLGSQQWTSQVARMYGTHASCVEKQYSHYSLQGVHMNGVTTLNENIADNGAIRLAYSAYRKDLDSESWTLPGVNLTDNQMFFLGYAQIMCAVYTPQYEIEAITTDEHSYPEFRVRGVYNNMPEFLEAFKCPKPDESKKVCRVW